MMARIFILFALLLTTAAYAAKDSACTPDKFRSTAVVELDLFLDIKRHLKLNHLENKQFSLVVLNKTEEQIDFLVSASGEAWHVEVKTDILRHILGLETKAHLRGSLAQEALVRATDQAMIKAHVRAAIIAYLKKRDSRIEEAFIQMIRQTPRTMQLLVSPKIGALRPAYVITLNHDLLGNISDDIHTDETIAPEKASVTVMRFLESDRAALFKTDIYAHLVAEGKKESDLLSFRTIEVFPGRLLVYVHAKNEQGYVVLAEPSLTLDLDPKDIKTLRHLKGQKAAETDRRLNPAHEGAILSDFRAAIHDDFPGTTFQNFYLLSSATNVTKFFIWDPTQSSGYIVNVTHDFVREKMYLSSQDFSGAEGIHINARLAKPLPEVGEFAIPEQL